uniref:PPUP7734 n=1 Tax=Poeciliopsis prolifica TaxID=188132 RepID=A0A0S7EMI0_9TELE
MKSAVMMIDTSLGCDPGMFHQRKAQDALQGTTFLSWTPWESPGGGGPSDWGEENLGLFAMPAANKWKTICKPEIGNPKACRLCVLTGRRAGGIGEVYILTTDK